MASIIRIKRSTTSGNPGTLGAGELAYSALPDSGSNGGDRLYIGIGTETSGDAANHYVIGGKYFTDKLDHTPGTLTASSAIIVDSNSKIDDLKVDNLELNGNTISSTNSNGNITIDPNGSGYVEIAGTNGVVIPVGTTAQQGPAVQGAIRFNTDSSQFEGYSGANWSSLGGVRSVDGLTYISAELTAGASDDTLRFYSNGSLQLALDTDSLDVSSGVVVNINDTTQSTSYTEGALIVDGGVGIAKNLNVHGDFAVDGAFALSGDVAINGGDLYSTATTFNLLNKDTSSSGTNDGPTTVNAFLNAGTISIGASSGTTTVNNDLVTSGDLTVSGNDIKMSGGTTALTFSGTGDVATNGDLKVGGNDIKASDGTTAITLSDSTGNVAVAGDLTVTGNDIKSSSATAITLSGADVSVAGDLTVTGNDIKSSTGTAITLAGTKVTANGDLDVSSNLHVTGTTQLDSTTTVGQAGTRTGFTVYGTSLDITGSAASTIGVDAATGSAITLTLQSTNSVGDANMDVNVDDAFTLDATTVSIDGTDTSNFSMNANSSSNKTLTIDAANAGSGDAILALGSSSTDSVNVTTTSTTGKVTVAGGELQADVDTLDVNANIVTIDATGASNAVTITSDNTTLNSDSVTFRGTSGSGDNMTLTVTGDVQVDNININGNTISTTDGSNTLYLDPAPTNDNGGTVIIKGDLQVDGTTTTINSTQVTIDDPVFTLGGDTTPGSDDGLDRGIKYSWYDTANTAAKIGFFGYDNSAKEFVFIADAAETSSTFDPSVSDIYGNVRFGKLALDTTTASTNTSSGALIVAGGVGIAGQLNVGGTTSKFTSSQASSSTTSGALVVTGGVGVGGTIYVGTNVTGAGPSTSTLDGFNIDAGTY